jgi:signal transduction histidine kinase/CheY-like chemotaxis protein
VDVERLPGLQVLKTGRPVPPTVFSLVRPGAAVRWLRVSARPLGSAGGAVVSFTDITDQRRQEDILRQSQRMEAVGRLAGGIAHDFNNLLTVILGYTEMLLEQQRDETGSSDLQGIRRAATRAADLTRQLLAFSRRQVLQPKVLRLNELVTETANMLRRLIGENIRLHLDLPADVWPVRADPTQLDQIILNLAINARDAMPGGGDLSIRTANVRADAAFVTGRAGMVPGSYVQLSVEDTGTGMDAETLQHIFEPFFTTKGLGKGTGLGLATVYGIVKQSGGWVYCLSEPGRGTRFQVFLPRAEEGDLSSSPAPRDLRGGSETILLVEDEAPVRRIARTILERAGYRVLEASTAEEALGVAAGPVSLLLTDVIMPGMSGRDLALRLLSDRPDLKVIYMSGYPDEALGGHEILEAEVAFLEKPFTADGLLAKVRSVLDV